ncbi:MAG: peptidoglycan bridge formation glycyltransferase FemA/FemB family protein [bacterium]|nr:peptidoglycan bridge formation glycyltransferase FemA/FemB family protein [bacterium]
MEVKLVESRQDWKNFLLYQDPNSFLQSWDWGDFNQALGKEVFRLGIYSQKELVGICLLIKEKLRFATALYSPRGPVIDWQKKEVFKAFVKKASELGREEKVDFVKLEPNLLAGKENEKLFRTFGFKRAINFIQAETVWVLDLDKTEEEMLYSMRKTTRYLIRDEEKKGVKVEASRNPGEVEEFARLLNQTSFRKGFSNHSKDYYQKQFEILAKDDQMLVFKSVKSGHVQAMSIVAYYGEAAYYLHGASRPGEGSVGYLLQWEAIKEAKRRGMKYYNFWGVAAENEFKPRHPWYGFTLFKTGFGGRRVEYLRAQDLPLTPRYTLQRRADHILSLIKKFRGR